MAVSWQNIGDRIRRQADQASAFYTDLALIDFINAAGGELWGLLADNFTDFCVKDPAPTINVVAGTDSYQVAGADLLRILGVDILLDTTYVAMTKLNFIERNDFVDRAMLAPAQRGRPTSYFLYGENIVLRPTPDTNITAGLKVYYVPQFARITAVDLATAGNAPAVFEKNMWDQMIVDGACARAKAMEESVDDAQLFDSWKLQTKERIVQEKQRRDAGQPKNVTMVRRPMMHGPRRRY